MGTDSDTGFGRRKRVPLASRVQAEGPQPPPAALPPLPPLPFQMRPLMGLMPASPPKPPSETPDRRDSNARASVQHPFQPPPAAVPAQPTAWNRGNASSGSSAYSSMNTTLMTPVRCGCISLRES